MKNMIPYYRLFIIVCFFAISYAEILKPSNDKYDVVKITDENNKTRMYFRLIGNDPLIFENLDDFVIEKDVEYAVKIISRAKISPNSSSSKTFGIDLKIIKNDFITMEKKLTYKKGPSSAKKATKSGFNYTQGGFWFEKLEDIKSTKILISKMEGSPGVDIRVVIEEIKPFVHKKIIKTVNKEKTHRVFFYKKGKKDEYEDSSGWYSLKKDEKLQYKIQGPMQIRILTRSVFIEDLVNYNLIVNENGRYMGNFLYDIIPSKKDAHFLINDEKINVSNYKVTYLNVPRGIHYYSMETSEKEDQEIFVKLQSALIE